MKKIIFSIVTLINLAWFSLASFDLDISSISLSNWWDTVALFTNPSIDITIDNIWDSLVENNWIISEWFISCIESASQNTVFNSSSMNLFRINPGTYMIAGNLSLKDTLTQTQRTVNIECFVNKNGNYSSNLNETENNINNNSMIFSFNVDKLWRFDSSMNRAIEPIRNNLDGAEPWSTLGWWDSIRSFIFNKIMNVVVPIVVVVWILVGIIWIYRMFFTDSAEETKKWLQLILYWALGIIIIFSAKYIWTVIFENLFEAWNASWITWVDLSIKIYEQIAYPFIKIIIYLALWWLFLILAGKAFSFITNTDWSSQKKAISMISRSTIAMLIIIWAKQIVEAVFGKEDQVLNPNPQNLGDIGTWILADKSIPLIYSIINRVLWLTSLVILIIILIQTFQILVDPQKSDNRQRIWKSIVYMFIGILVIWAGYLITNFLIIN